MATKFNVLISWTDPLADFSSSATAEAGLQTNFTTGSIQVLPHSGHVGNIKKGNGVNGVISGASGKVVLVTATQILIENISGVFQVEKIQKDANNYVISTDVGDSPIVHFHYKIFGEGQNVYWSGATCDATNYFIFENTQDPKGIYNSLLPFMAIANNFAIKCGVDYMIFKKMQVEMVFFSNNQSQDCYAIDNSTRKGIIFDRCIANFLFAQSGGVASAGGFNLSSSQSGAGERCGAINCVAINFDLTFGSGDFGFYGGVGSTSFIYYCNAYNCGAGGFDTVIGMLLKNNISDSNIVDYLGAGVKTNCLSSDATGSTGLQNKDPSYVNEVGKDFHLVTAGSDGYKSGADLSSDSVYPINTDVDGDGRSIIPCVGYDEVFALGGHSIQRGLRKGLEIGIL